MAPRVVLFGATGYTGRLTAKALVARGERPVLAGRDARALAVLAAELGGLPTALANADDPASVRALVEAGDVLVTTVSPFGRYGAVALEAAAGKGAIYLDAACESPFTRQVFETYGPRGGTLLSGFGYDAVAGNLAAGLALEGIGEDAARVDVAYFVGGGSLWPAASAGTLESVVPVLSAPRYTYRKGIVPELRPRVRDFAVGARMRPALTAGGVEHYTLPRLAPGLQEVDRYVGMLGPATRAAAALPRLLVAWAGGIALNLLGKQARRRPRQPTLTTRVVAIVYDAVGTPLGEVHLSGVDPYDFTARFLAWSAVRALEGVYGTGALGPVEAFGLEALQAGCAEAGIVRVSG
ncbi:MAG TPA: hypothetical protein VNW94_16845 [Streptosporangiaceae bacterium]|nr:hypothetical protein [Streptosporangiaceae bacterium]